TTRKTSSSSWHASWTGKPRRRDIDITRHVVRDRRRLGSSASPRFGLGKAVRSASRGGREFEQLRSEQWPVFEEMAGSVACGFAALIPFVVGPGRFDEPRVGNQVM